MQLLHCLARHFCLFFFLVSCKAASPPPLPLQRAKEPRGGVGLGIPLGGGWAGEQEAALAAGRSFAWLGAPALLPAAWDPYERLALARRGRGWEGSRPPSPMRAPPLR